MNRLPYHDVPVLAAWRLRHPAARLLWESFPGLHPKVTGLCALRRRVQRLPGIKHIVHLRLVDLDLDRAPVPVAAEKHHAFVKASFRCHGCESIAITDAIEPNRADRRTQRLLSLIAQFLWIIMLRLRGIRAVKLTRGV